MNVSGASCISAASWDTQHLCPARLKNCEGSGQCSHPQRCMSWPGDQETCSINQRVLLSAGSMATCWPRRAVLKPQFVNVG